MANIIAQLAPLWQKLEQERNLPLGYLDRLAKVESSYNPNARNPKSSAGGLYQFIDSTAGRYGLTDKFDPFASSEAAARLAADNAAHLRKNGIEPDAGNLYLAHQQGPAGAVKLLRGGDAPASSVVGGAEAGLNGGGGKSASGMANMWRSKFSDVGGGAATNAAPPTEGQTDMAGAADLPAPGAVQAGGASQFAIPGETPFAGKEAAGGMDWDTLMMGMALLANAVPNGTPSKDIGSIMSPFLSAQAKKEDRNYARGRDAKQDARYDRTETRQNTMDAQSQANWQAQFGLSKSAAERADAAAARAEAKPLIQEFKDDAGNRVYKQFDMNSRSWVPLSDGSSAAPTPAASPPPPASTSGSPAMDGLPPASGPMAAPQAAAPAIPAAPPGVNREVWARKLTEDAAAAAGGAAPTVRQVKQPDGSEVAVQWDPAQKTWVPLVAPQGGNAVKAPPKLTEGQSKDIGYYNRGAGALAVLDPLQNELTSSIENLKSGVPLVGNMLNTEGYQKAKQAGREYLASILRKDTGAAVTAGEEQLYGQIFLPQPGDKPGVIAQKAEARTRALEAIRSGLGTAEALAAARPPAPDREAVNQDLINRSRQTNGQPLKVRSPAEARKLPSGTKIELPDGSTGVVP